MTLIINNFFLFSTKIYTLNILILNKNIKSDFFNLFLFETLDQPI